MNVSFAELKHENHGCNTVPYGIATVAACVIEEFNCIDAQIFKETTEFTQYLGHTIPDVACFSNYIWNFNISYQFAKRIKNLYPNTIIVFGGPNFPIDIIEQEKFLLNHQEIDFYVCGDGELAIVELFRKFISNDVNVDKIIYGRTLSYLGNMPSPYLTGLCDKFLYSGLVPLIQTTRGCPFSCTFCQQGSDFRKIARYSLGKISSEIEYIARRTTHTDLMLADANFGMYKEDIAVCEVIADIKKTHYYPKYFYGLEGKNNKNMVMKAASIIKGAYLSAAVQSTDASVLENIKRRNVSTDEMIEIGKYSEVLGMNSFSEVILCLPGDTKEAHFKSILDLIDAGISIVRSHQLIMLPSAEIGSKESRDKYGIKTVFRVSPNTTNRYSLFGETFIAPEIDEICVANNTMTFDDYLECRLFDLTVEIFYNYNVTSETIKFLKQHEISIPSFVMELHNYIMNIPNKLSSIYEDFLRETREVWENKEELKEFLIQENVIDRYIAGELGNNEQLFYRDTATTNHMDDIQEIAYNVAEKLINKRR